MRDVRFLEISSGFLGVHLSSIVSGYSGYRGMGQQDEYPNGRKVFIERLQELPLPGMVTEDDCALEWEPYHL